MNTSTAIMNIIEHVIIVWDASYDKHYDPMDSGSNLLTLVAGTKYYLNMRNAVYWDWYTPPEAAPFASIDDISNIPSSHEPGMVAFSVGVKNVGPAAGIIYLQPHLISGTVDMAVGGGQWAGVNQRVYFLISFTMQQFNVTFSLRAWHEAGLGYDDTAGPFIISPEAPQGGEAKDLDVAYSKVV